MAAGRLHQIEQEYDGRVIVTYKAFPLGATRAEINRMFGSPERAKTEILGHWTSAKQLDGGVEINPELMATRPFPYPYSMPALRAVKAAEFQGGMEAHAKLYDRLQRAHLVEARDVSEPQTLLECAAEIGLDLQRFQMDLADDSTLQAVHTDQQEALARGVSATPTVVLNDQWALPGAMPIELYRQVIDDLLAGNNPNRRAA